MLQRQPIIDDVKKMCARMARFSHVRRSTSHYLHDNESFCAGTDLRHRSAPEYSAMHRICRICI